MFKFVYNYKVNPHHPSFLITTEENIITLYSGKVQHVMHRNIQMQNKLTEGKLGTDAHHNTMGQLHRLSCCGNQIYSRTATLTE
jgi:hypothetical protein